MIIRPYRVYAGPSRLKAVLGTGVPNASVRVGAPPKRDASRLGTHSERAVQLRLCGGELFDNFKGLAGVFHFEQMGTGFPAVGGVQDHHQPAVEGGEV